MSEKRGLDLALAELDSRVEYQVKTLNMEPIKGLSCTSFQLSSMKFISSVCQLELSLVFYSLSRQELFQSALIRTAPTNIHVGLNS